MGYHIKERETLPDYHSKTEELADFFEFRCLLSDEFSYSVSSATSALSMSADDTDTEDYEDDPDEVDGINDMQPEVGRLIHADETVNDIQDQILSRMEEVLGEIEERTRRCGQSYPFKTDRMNICLRDDISRDIIDVYTFLLLVTRVSMTGGGCRIREGINATELFEQLCALILENYFGENSHCYVFGTGAYEGGTFQSKLQEMLSRISENGIEVRDLNKDMRKQKDGKVDLVLFIPFSDNRCGSFLAFGQCKTGQSWRTQISQLNPLAFCEMFLSRTPTFHPIGIYMVSESFSDQWEWNQRQCRGILFDRNRIMEYLPKHFNTSEKSCIILDKIRKWNSSVMMSLN